jgi:hypothetical protein
VPIIASIIRPIKVMATTTINVASEIGSPFLFNQNKGGALIVAIKKARRNGTIRGAAL